MTALPAVPGLRRLRRLAPAALLALTLPLAACGGDDGDAEGAESPSVTETPSPSLTETATETATEDAEVPSTGPPLDEETLAELRVASMAVGEELARGGPAIGEATRDSNLELLQSSMASLQERLTQYEGTLDSLDLTPIQAEADAVRVATVEANRALDSVAEANSVDDAMSDFPSAEITTLSNRIADMARVAQGEG